MPEMQPTGPIPSVIQGEFADASNTFYADLGDEIIRQNHKQLNDTIKQLLTYSTSLASGGLVFLNDAIVGKSWRLAAVSFFFVAMIVTLLGVLPYSAHVTRRCPSEVKDALERGNALKDGVVWFAAIFIVLGLGVAMWGVYVGPPIPPAVPR
jgi:hypothetical protein